MKFQINLGTMSMEASSITFDMQPNEVLQLAKNETFRSLIRRLSPDAAKEFISKAGHHSVTGESPDMVVTKNIPESEVPAAAKEAAAKDEIVDAFDVDLDLDEIMGDESTEYLTTKANEIKAEMRRLYKLINDGLESGNYNADDMLGMVRKSIQLRKSYKMIKAHMAKG